MENKYEDVGNDTFLTARLSPVRSEEEYSSISAVIRSEVSLPLLNVKFPLPGLNLILPFEFSCKVFISGTLNVNARVPGCPKFILFPIALLNDKGYVGLLVPIPTFPPFVTTKLVPVELPIANAGAFPFALVGLIDSCAHGDDEANPVLPVKLLTPVNVLLSANSVDEANVHVDVE